MLIGAGDSRHVSHKRRLVSGSRVQRRGRWLCGKTACVAFASTGVRPVSINEATEDQSSQQVCLQHLDRLRFARLQCLQFLDFAAGIRPDLRRNGTTVCGNDRSFNIRLVRQTTVMPGYRKRDWDIRKLKGLRGTGLLVVRPLVITFTSLSRVYRTSQQTQSAASQGFRTRRQRLT